jgi:hypothetical protein
MPAVLLLCKKNKLLLVALNKKMEKNQNHVLAIVVA